MNTARTLSTAAFATAAIFASFGVAAAPAAGEFSAVPDAVAHSTVSRAAVAEEAKLAVANFKNFYVAPVSAQSAELTRAQVRSEAVTAVRAHDIAAGNFS